ncbi:helix-turn-helix domain-containing protein [Streptomyces xanthochromogenes]|uniref:helix-turn-helix domain-containing protein n=1 Tax=Streptomyces xanthochromogenes TaxID=67384 RepID=UPI00342E417E
MKTSVMSTNLLCAGEGCRRRADGGGTRGLPSPGRLLCSTCRLALARRLHDLPGLYHECGEVLGAPLQVPQERTSGGPLPGMPFNAAAADIRSELLATLGTWSGLVCEQRRVPAPRRTVEELSAFLSRHAEWLSAHPAAAEVTEEVARVAAAARRVARPGGTRRRTVGACVVPACPGELGAVVGDTPHPLEVRCDANPEHTWAGHQWTQLSLSLRRATTTGVGAWLTASDVARLWQTPVGTVYRLASEQSWERRRQGTRTLYRAADVQECFNRRAERPGTGCG